MERQIVLCGSMSSLSVMSLLAAQLRQAGIRAVIPEADDDALAGDDALLAIKAAASRRHFDRIVEPATAAVLVVNLDRHGTPNYVGPNAFAEAAVAFVNGRPVYLLQGMPSAYSDELAAWGAKCLFGDLSRLAADLSIDLDVQSAGEALLAG